jgi:hypothetical protein
MKDIFVDNNVAKNFCNPMSQDYKDLIEWLKKHGSLVVSDKLLGEYSSSTSHAYSLTNIGVIVDHLTRAGRLNKIGKPALRAFGIPRRVEKTLRSNREDWVHLKTVLLSFRKIAISRDKKLRYDIENFPRYHAIAVARPSDINYS